jgi:hypothetical protein
MTSPDTAILERPFYFIVVLWGERFCDYFLDLCLPTLVSPGNLPALSTKLRSKFLIWTYPDDWMRIKAAPIFKLLERYADPVFSEIPPCPPGESSKYHHMGIGHRLGLEMAYQENAHPLVLTPDSMFSDGTLARLQQLASEGVELVLMPAIPFAEEPFYENLLKLGISPRNRNGIAEPICIGSRQLVHAALGSLHSQTMTYEWDAPYFFREAPAVWWRIPGETGMLVNSLSWAAPLIDFKSVQSHDTSTFDEWTFDGDYVFRNLGNIKNIHLALDSDEMFIVSWAPLDDKPYSLKPQFTLRSRLIGALTRRMRFSDWFYGGLFDPLKQTIFFQPAKWHSQPLNQRWEQIEKRALRVLLSCVAPPTGARNVLSASVNKYPERIAKTNAVVLAQMDQVGLKMCRLATAVLRAAHKPLRVPLKWAAMVERLWSNRSTIVLRFKQIWHGDHTARRRVMWRMRLFAHQAVGLKFDEPEPAPPSIGSSQRAE